MVLYFDNQTACVQLKLCMYVLGKATHVNTCIVSHSGVGVGLITLEQNSLDNFR